MPAVMLSDDAFKLITECCRLAYLLNDIGGVLAVHCVDGEGELAAIRIRKVNRERVPVLTFVMN